MALGVLFREGTGVKQSYAEAARLFKLAADHRIPFAQVALGSLYEDGRGVEQNLAEAVRLYRLVQHRRKV